MGDLEDFLRQAAERARAKKRQAAQKKKPPQVKPARQPARPRPQQQPAPKHEPLGSDIAEHVTQQMGQSQVSEHVLEHMAEGELGRHADSLGSAIAREEEVMEAELEAKFGERNDQFVQFEHASSEETYGGATADKPLEGATVDALLALFRSPAQLRQAILASEILRRPEERW